MSQFYSRYVPPVPNPVRVRTSEPKDESRKRQRKSEARPKNKKPKLSASNDEEIAEKTGNNSFNFQDGSRRHTRGPAELLGSESSSHGSETIVSKYKVTATATEEGDEVQTSVGRMESRMQRQRRLLTVKSQCQVLKGRKSSSRSQCSRETSGLRMTTALGNMQMSCPNSIR